MLCTSLLMRPQPPFGGNPQEGWGICLELRQALSYLVILPELDSGKIRVRG